MKTYFTDILLCLSACLCSCSGTLDDFSIRQGIVLDFGPLGSKSGIADEDAVWDINFYVFGEDGTAEEHNFTQFPSARYGQIHLMSNLLKNREYTIAVFANAGYDMGTMNWDDFKSVTYHISRPDGFSHGIPMLGKVMKYEPAQEAESLRINMERLLSKVTVKLDRRYLDKEVDFNVSLVRVGNCPKVVGIMPPSRIESPSDIFQSGYYTDGGDISDVYLLENMQGRLDKELCSYIELEIDYDSPTFYTEGGRCLKYRFYLREGNSYMVQRNCHYTVTVCPQKDGLLCEDSWRVDKSALIEKEALPYLKITPRGTTMDGVFYENYYELPLDGQMHFGLVHSPSNMKIWLRDDLVEDEEKDGRALYTMDADGNGFTVKSLGKACTTIMEIMAGPPLNDSITIAIEIF